MSISIILCTTRQVIPTNGISQSNDIKEVKYWTATVVPLKKFWCRSFNFKDLVFGTTRERFL
jgi:hypothetical protein